jgi:hypothetical protein
MITALSALNMPRIFTLAYNGHHLTKTLFYNSVLNISCNILSIVLKVKNRLGMVAHICNLIYSGDQGDHSSRLAWTKVSEMPF